MGCKRCNDATTLFRQKIGRCRDCAIQLSVLSLVAWPSWYYFSLQNPRSIETLITLLAAASFSLLLLLHALVWLFTKGKGLVD